MTLSILQAAPKVYRQLPPLPIGFHRDEHHIATYFPTFLPNQGASHQKNSPITSANHGALGYIYDGFSERSMASQSAV